jgi:hypothetical protein
MLYWFRTPPNLRVGRSPFDEDMRRTLQTRYPEITFDWTALSELPPLPPDPEPWRERRRLARLMRESAAELEAGEDIPEPADDTIASDVLELQAAADEVADADANDQTAPPDGTPAPRRRRRRRGRNRHSSGAGQPPPASADHDNQH